MLASISPFGERARGQRWGVTVGFYLLGSLAGGALLGGVLGVAGSIVPGGAARLVAAAAVTAVAALVDLAPRRLPTVRRQVDRAWLQLYRGWLYGLGFGFQLGLGVVTIVTTASLYAAFGLAALTGSALGGAVVGGGFGLARALPLLGLWRVWDGEHLRRAHARLQRWHRRAGAASVAVLALSSVGLALTAALR